MHHEQQQYHSPLCSPIPHNLIPILSLIISSQSISHTIHPSYVHCRPISYKLNAILSLLFSTQTYSSYSHDNAIPHNLTTTLSLQLPLNSKILTQSYGVRRSPLGLGTRKKGVANAILATRRDCTGRGSAAGKDKGKNEQINTHTRHIYPYE